MTETNNRSAYSPNNKKQVINWVSLINKTIINDQN